MGAKGVGPKGEYALKAVVPVQGAAAAVEVEVRARVCVLLCDGM